MSRGFRSAPAPSRSRPDQLPPDQHAADLVGARADVEELGVTEEPLDGPVLGVAGAAQRLDRLERDLLRVLLGFEYCWV